MFISQQPNEQIVPAHNTVRVCVCVCTRAYTATIKSGSICTQVSETHPLGLLLSLKFFLQWLWC